jgi:gluconokinase
VSLRVVVMGVSGSGKSTVGELLAARLDLPYADADQFHSPTNVARMAAGTPLTDEDRRPWLEAIAHWLAEHEDGGCVVTCSALKRAYRDVLRRGADDAWFLHLSASQELMTERVAGRPRHFMPADLVASQFETLEPPGPDERAVTVDAALTPDQIITAFLAQV